MHKIILLSGKQGSGKSTLAEGLEGVARERGYVVIRTRFAKVIYEMHDAVVAIAKKYGIPVGPKEGELLQYLGTDYGRRLKGEDVWVNALKCDLQKTISFHKEKILGTMPLCFIIDDMRFQNEFDVFDTTDEIKVHKLRLEASKEARKARCSYWRENDTHPSEVGLDHVVEKITNGFDVLLNTDLLDCNRVLDFAAKAVFK